MELGVDPVDDAVRLDASDRGRAGEGWRIVPALERESLGVPRMEADVVGALALEAELVAAIAVEERPRPRHPATRLIPVRLGVTAGHRIPRGVRHTAADLPASRKADRRRRDRAGVEHDLVRRVDRPRGAPAARQVEAFRVRGADALIRLRAHAVATRGKVGKLVMRVGVGPHGRQPLPRSGAGLEAVQFDQGVGERGAGGPTDDATRDAAPVIAQRRRGGREQPDDAHEDSCCSHQWRANREGKAHRSSLTEAF